MSNLSYLYVEAYDMLYSENVQYAVPEIILLYNNGLSFWHTKCCNE